MSTHTPFPRIQSVEALPGHRLITTFRNGEQRHYDFTPQLQHEHFALLRNEAFFRSVQADPHGYGIVWNDEMDLAASELWLNGVPASHATALSAAD